MNMMCLCSMYDCVFTTLVSGIYLLLFVLLKLFFPSLKTACGIVSFMFHYRMPRREPPPPPPPTVEALLALMIEDRQATCAESAATIAALQQLAQNNANNNNNHNNNGRLKNFQNTNPPVFTRVVEALVADDWLHTIENNLEVAGVAANDKVLYATHFLAGPARTWWETDRKSTRLNSSHITRSRMPSSA